LRVRAFGLQLFKMRSRKGNKADGLNLRRA
jgi:hypothetical protein